MNSATLSFKAVRVHKLQRGPTKAFVHVSVNDALLIKGVRIVEGKSGVFVSMPKEQGKDKKWYDSVMCLSDDVRDDIFQVALAAYQDH